MLKAGVIAGAIGTILGILKELWPWKSIELDERAIKTRLGRTVLSKRDFDDNGNRRIKWYGPGTLFVIPKFHKLRRIRIFPQTVVWGERMIKLADGIVYHAQVGLYYKVVDPYKALFNIERLEEAMDFELHGRLTTLVALRDSREASQPQTIADELTALAAPRFADWGVEILMVSFPIFRPDEPSAELLQIETRANLFREMEREMGAGIALGLITKGGVIVNATGDTVATSTGRQADEAEILPITAAKGEHHTHLATGT